MKNVFALRGKSNTGKSQTIRTVVEMLTGNHPDAGIQHNHTTRVDVRVVLTINGLKIGIESQGDPHGSKDSLDLFQSVECDVIVCATRTRGTTVDAVNALQGYQVLWFEQRIESEPKDWVLSDLAMARELTEEVEKAIGYAQPVVLSRAAGR